MGQDRVGAPAVVDSYRPGAFALTPFATEHAELPERAGAAGQAGGAAPVPGAPAWLALRRCRQPVPARVAVDARERPIRVSTDRRGFAGGRVLACAGPWRTSGAWWEDEPLDPPVGGEGGGASGPGRTQPACPVGRLEPRRVGRVARRWGGLPNFHGPSYRGMVHRRHRGLSARLHSWCVRVVCGASRRLGVQFSSGSVPA